MPDDASPKPELDLGAVLQALVETQQKTAETLAQVSERLEALETRGAGTLDLPDGIPEPNGIEWPTWHDMDNVQRAAWIRANEGATPPPPPETEAQTVDLGNGLWAEFPVPSEEAKEAWKIRAPAIFENVPREFPVTQEAAIEAYGKGGPLWLAAMGSKAHAWLMDLPYPWKQEMVAQVTSYAPVEGAALGRDLLKAKTDQQRDYGYAENLGFADQRKDGIVARPGPGYAVQPNEF